MKQHHANQTTNDFLFFFFFFIKIIKNEKFQTTPFRKPQSELKAVTKVTKK